MFISDNSNISIGAQVKNMNHTERCKVEEGDDDLIEDYCWYQVTFKAQRIEPLYMLEPSPIESALMVAL
jgi:hypothetical protein